MSKECFYVPKNLLHLVEETLPDAIGIDFKQPLIEQLYPHLDKIEGSEPRTILPDNTPQADVKRMMNMVSSAHRRIQMTIATRQKSWPLWFKNSLENYEAVTSRGIPIHEASWDLKAKPCVIIGNGPSLTETLVKILKNRNDYALIAVWHALPKLEAVGLKPDAIIHVDKLAPQDMPQPQALPANVPIIASPVTASSFFKSFPNQPLYVVYSRENEGNLQWAEYMKIQPHKPTLGTVISGAMQAAQYLGHKKIILTGVDLCFTDETNMIASGYKKQIPSAKKIENNEGKECLTLHQFLSYKEVLESQAKQDSQHIQFYNASPGGLKLNGYSDWQF